MQPINEWSESHNPGEPSEYDFHAPTLAEAHALWHAVHGRDTLCPLDCGIGETYDEDPGPRRGWLSAATARAGTRSPR